jgi:hypothetical protein
LGGVTVSGARGTEERHESVALYLREVPVACEELVARTEQLLRGEGLAAASGRGHVRKVFRAAVEDMASVEEAVIRRLAEARGGRFVFAAGTGTHEWSRSFLRKAGGTCVGR